MYLFWTRLCREETTADVKDQQECLDSWTLKLSCNAVLQVNFTEVKVFAKDIMYLPMTTPPRTSEMSPRDRSPVRTSSPRHPSGKDPRNQWTTYTLTLLQLEQTTDSSGRRGTGPPTEPGFSQGFFSILSSMEFSFLAAVASGLLSWGHFISSTIIDLIAQILFKLN